MLYIRNADPQIIGSSSKSWKYKGISVNMWKYKEISENMWKYKENICVEKKQHIYKNIPIT
jgi:hypothetical protein